MKTDWYILMKLTLKQLKIEYKISGIFSILLFLLAATTCYYMDLRTLTVWTVNVWDNIYETGNPLIYYAYSALNYYGLDHAMVGSDFLIYLPWAIWNLPIWILQRFFGLTILEHPLMLFYSKSFLILLLVLTCIMVKKIAALLTDDTEELFQNLVLYASSFFVLTGIAYIGQNDILVILTMLLAIYNLLKGNMKKFVLWAALSIAFKPFFIFSYIALVLLKEKKIHRICLYGIAGISIYFLQKIPFMNAPMYKESLSYGPTSNVIGLLLNTKLPISAVGVSLFVLSLLIVYLMAYLDNPENKTKEKYIYYCTLPFICFFAFTNFESYRPIYLFVLFYLLMLTKPQYRRINLWLETISTGCLIIYYMVSDTLFYNGHYIHLPFDNVTFSTITAFFETNLPNVGLSAFMSAFIFCMICIAITNHPKFESKNSILVMKEERYLIILRGILFAVPLLFAITLKYI